MPEQSADDKALPFPGTDYGNPDSRPEWMRIDWRRHLQRLDLPGATVNYAEIGSGEPILFVHGLAGCWRNWLENLPYFGRHYRAIALDLPGFGDSPMPSWEISMPNYARLIHDFCERLGIDRVAALVGNSMGGFVAAETAVQFPERVERLVLVSAAGITSSDLRREPVMAWGRMAMLAGARGVAEKRMAIVRPRIRHLVYSTIMRHPSRIAAEMLWEMSEGAGRSAFRPALEAILDYDFRDRLGDIVSPTLIVWGGDDMLVPVEDADAFEHLIGENAHAVIFEDTGHLAMMERPSRFNELLVSFIAGEREPELGIPGASPL
jgi:pimeloyl-ACP methyl ester carboxylesterase